MKKEHEGKYMATESITSKIKTIYAENEQLKNESNKYINGLNQIIKLRNNFQENFKNISSQKVAIDMFKKYFEDEGKILMKMKQF